MTKRILYIILPVLILSACNKALDIDPQNSLTFKNGLEDAKNYEAILRGAGLDLLGEARDESSHQPSKGEYADDDQLGDLARQLSPQQIMSGHWQWHYQVISQANVVLNFIDGTKLPKERKDLYKGQAYFFKALIYFELIRQYGDCVIVPDVVTSDPQAKAPMSKVATYAIDLAQKAVDLLPEFDQVKDYNGVSAVYKSTPAKGPANALLAHLCAWKAGTKYFSDDQNFDENELWDRAEKAATAVIGSGQYSLAANPETVVTNTLVGGDRESIYETVFRDQWSDMSPFLRTISFLQANSFQAWPAVPLTGTSSRATLRISNASVVRMYPDGDLRRNAYFYMFDEMSKPIHIFESQGYAYPYKWRQIFVSTQSPNIGQFQNYNENKIWWRLADIILLRAECRVRLNKPGPAVEDLNTIRTRANAVPYSSAEYNGDLRYAIYKEREKELLLEGCRYYDVIRNGYASTELKGGFRTATVQDFKDGAFFLMINPSNFGILEFATNPALRQNIYWAKFL